MKRIIRLFLIFSGTEFITLAIGFVFGLKYSSQETIKAKVASDKHLELFKLAVKWIKEPEKLEKFIDNNRDQIVGVYGMSYLGDCLQEIFRKRGMRKLYGIDRNAHRLYNQYIPIYGLEDELPFMNIIIVTSFLYYEQIKQELELKVDSSTSIISLEDIFNQ